MTKHLKVKDYLLRKRLLKNDQKIFIYKFFNKNQQYSKKFRFKIMLKYQELYKNHSNSKLVNRCIDSKQFRSTNVLTNLSKASFKNKLFDGSVNGFRKSS